MPPPVGIISDRSAPSSSSNGAGNVTAILVEPPLIVRVLEMAARHKPKLASLNSLLKGVVQAARNVVKGTDSQRRFNFQFKEFCENAVIVVADMEDALYEYHHPGSRASDAADSDVHRIQEDEMLRTLAAYVASHTTAFGTQYLEHVAVSSLQKKLCSKRDRQSNSSSSAPQTGKKKNRVDPKAFSAAVNSVGLSTGGVIEGHSLLQMGTGVNGHAGSARQRVVGDGGVEQYVSDGSQLVLGGYPPTPALFFSGRGGGTGGVVFDLRKESQQLSVIPEISQLVQPWTVPQPFTSGVAMDRVTIEKERRSLAPPSGNTSGGARDAPSYRSPLRAGTGFQDASPAQSPSGMTLFDVCFAPTPGDFLRRLEQRQLLMSSSMSDRDKNVGGALPTTGPAKRRNSLSSPAFAAMGSTTNSPAMDGRGSTEGEAAQTKALAFFPRVDAMRNTSVPMSVMTSLVYYGISSLDFPYRH